MRTLLLALVLAASPVAFAQTTTSQQPAVAGVAGSAAQPLADVATLLAQIDQSAQAANLDLAKLRIDKWKADSGAKQQSQSNADSISRNLTQALPALTGTLRQSPQDLVATFKLYRDLNALNDVWKSLAESAGAFGKKDEFSAVSQQGATFDDYRSRLGDYLEQLAAGKDAELARLRAGQTKASAAKVLPKKIIVDNDEPVKKKTTKRKSATTTSQPK